jgi:hypothetical protein
MDWAICRACVGPFGASSAVVHGSVGRSDGMTDTPQILLAPHLKALKLPTF